MLYIYFVHKNFARFNNCGNTSLAETSLNNIKIFGTLKRFHFYLEPFHHAIKESNNVLFIEPLVKRFYMESFFFYNRAISSIYVFMT